MNFFTTVRCPLICAQRQDSNSISRHSYCVLELCRQLSVTRHDRPSVIFGMNRVPPLVDHRLDGEYHALSEHQASVWLSPMQDLWRFVHFSSDAMPAIFSYD